MQLLRPRPALLAAACAFVAVNGLAACGGSEDPASRVESLAPAENLWERDRPAEPEPLDASPESYGLPPLDVLQSNPAGVAQQLFRRAQGSTWTTKWGLYRDGQPQGEMLLASIPAGQAGKGGLFMTGTVGTPDTAVIRFDLLDRGEGPELCIQQGTRPIVCAQDLGQIDLSLEFLSVQGFAQLGQVLRDALAVPGLTVQYLKIAGEPATCFYFPPVDISQTGAGDIGVNFTKAGSFCLSREGALLQLKFDALDIVATSYRNSADPQMFELMGESS